MYHEKNYFFIIFINVAFFLLFSVFINPQIIAYYIDLWIFGNTQKGDDITSIPNPKPSSYQTLIGTLRLTIQPLAILTVNSGLIPSLCDIIGRFEGHKTKSQRQAAIMKKNFYFLFMNTIVVPLTLNTTLSLFFSNLKWDDLTYENIVAKIMANYAGLIFITLAI